MIKIAPKESKKKGKISFNVSLETQERFEQAMAKLEEKGHITDIDEDFENWIKKNCKVIEAFLATGTMPEKRKASKKEKK